MLPTAALSIRQIRTPAAFDDDAARTLGEVADIVRRSREAIWGAGQLSNAAEDIFRDLHDPWERVVLLGAYLEDRLVGRAEVRLPLVVHTRSAGVLLTVDPEAEAGGVGLELLSAAEQVAAGEARRVITIHTEHPGPEDLRGDGRIGSPTGTLPQIRPEDWITAADGSGRLPLSNRQTRFARSAGYDLRTVSDVSRLTVPLPQEELDRLTSEVLASQGAGDYRTHAWQDEAPEHWLDSLARLHARIPSDSFAGPEVWDPEPWDAQRVRRTEALRREDGDRSLMSVVEHIPTGELVGMTEVVIPQPHRGAGLQDETVVLREHRGRRLGLRLKLENLRQIARTAPEVEAIFVWTHSGNTRMNWVNRRLGARVVGRSAVWQREIGAA
ncbi:GNAT family N-acetyltransferase [Kocuria palustris]|uniref:GNAT family N-acetyltransferase n=1 Tax=Kocuria palustris TaxID=71999 RepID=UPI0011A40BF7|nr:GNAT family N-acetyltransferase [Kocuria palustris]